jgi:hypothetical protein
MTAAAFQSLGISDDMKERLNRLVIGVATMAADSFRNRGSRWSSPADLYGSRFCSSFRTSWINYTTKKQTERKGWAYGATYHTNLFRVRQHVLTGRPPSSSSHYSSRTGGGGRPVGGRTPLEGGRDEEDKGPRGKRGGMSEEE